MNIQFPKTLEDIAPESKVVHTSQVAHVTFYITEQNDRYKLFTWSEDRGVQQTWDETGEDENCTPWLEHSYDTYEYATSALAKEQVKLEQILEKKRASLPTPKQLHFLFRNQVPIPLDLTWGQASDLIDGKLNQIAKDKQTRRAERFHGFVEGDKVTFPWVTFEQIGEEKYQRKAIMKKGTIAKLHQAGKAGKIAYVEVGYTTYHVRDFKTMQKIEGEIKP